MRAAPLRFDPARNRGSVGGGMMQTETSTAAPVWRDDFYSDAVIRDPIPHYARMRAAGPVLWLPANGMFAVTHHAEIVEALRRADVFVSGRGLSLNDEVNAMLVGSTLNTDGDAHRRQRSVTATPIMPKGVDGLEHDIRVAAEALADRLVAAERFDAVRDFAQVLPLTIVTELVGLTGAGREKMLQWASATFNLFEGFNARSRDAFADMVDLQSFLRDHLKPELLRDGGLAARVFAVAPEKGFDLPAATQLLRDYINPSLDTTISALGFAAHYFAKWPEVWDDLRARPELIPNAVEEIVRMATPIRGFSRYVAEDTTLGGVAIPQGARVFLIYASGNRDADVFPDPDRFNPARANRKHLGFGHGVHACMGMHLARREMIVLLSAMARRVKRWEADGTPQVAMNNTIRAFARLPMRVVPE